MKISYNWLKTYLDIPAEGIADILTDTGLEVSGTEQLGMHPDIKDKLIVGKVLSVDPHPNADRLQLTRVDVGKEDPLQIVCGAPNVAAGQKVAVAPVGTTLHHINGSTLQIKKARIRGEESEGMICAEDEIGISDKHKGIIVLEKNAETGTAAATYLNTTADTVFEIDLTPNRIDGASHIG
ncbi:MAG: YtpR family tRNA-binding protein, partial [Flavobacteriales bacterium]